VRLGFNYAVEALENKLQASKQIYNNNNALLHRSHSRRDAATGHDSVDAILNMGGSNGDGDNNNVAKWFVCSFADKL
jgi:hypothetical protein